MELSDLLGMEASGLWQGWIDATLKDSYHAQIKGLDPLNEADSVSNQLKYAQGLSIIAYLKDKLGHEFAEFNPEEVLLNPDKENEFYAKLQAWYDQKDRSETLGVEGLEDAAGSSVDDLVTAPEYQGTQVPQAQAPGSAMPQASELVIPTPPAAQGISETVAKPLNPAYFRREIIKLGYEGIKHKLPIIHESLHKYDMLKSIAFWAAVCAGTAAASYLYAALTEASK